MWSRTKTLRRMVKLGSLPAQAAYNAGAFTSAAINPFADHSLGDMIGNKLYDLMNGEDGGGC